MEENILVIATKLEKIFPCGFFDAMEHLPIHLVQEAHLGGPVQTRWMHPFEIFTMRKRPNRNDEGDIDPVFPPISNFNQNGRGSKKHGKQGFTDMEMQSAVTHILLNCPEIQLYVKDKADWWVVIKSKPVGRIDIDNVLDAAYQNDVAIVQQQVDVELETTLQHPQHILEEMSSGGDCDRHREHLGVSQTNKAKMKKSTRRPIDPEDISGSISSAPERISHDTHLFSISFGMADPRQYYPNYHQIVGASSTSQSLCPRRYEDLPLQAIRPP
ncbi:hypothetical protein KY284_020260 [Solanum tuberosum]|nr:hypothetical protein KY284_020260 [Solanum tuberosum]